MQNPPEQRDSVILHPSTLCWAHETKSYLLHSRRCTKLCEEGLIPGGCVSPVGQRCSILLPHLVEVTLIPSEPTDPLSSLQTGQGAKQRDCIPTFHPNTESRCSWGRQQDPGVKRYSGSDCINTVSIKSVLFAFAAVPRVSENLTVPGTVQVQNKLTPI